MTIKRKFDADPGGLGQRLDEALKPHALKFRVPNATDSGGRSHSNWVAEQIISAPVRAFQHQLKACNDQTKVLTDIYRSIHFSTGLPNFNIGLQLAQKGANLPIELWYRNRSGSEDFTLYRVRLEGSVTSEKFKSLIDHMEKGIADDIDVSSNISAKCVGTIRGSQKKNFLELMALFILSSHVIGAAEKPASFRLIDLAYIDFISILNIQTLEQANRSVGKMDENALRSALDRLDLGAFLDFLKFIEPVLDVRYIILETLRRYFERDHSKTDGFADLAFACLSRLDAYEPNWSIEQDPYFKTTFLDDGKFAKWLSKKVKKLTA
jgi:hypothetical protein